jgi:hypothetical protein
MKKSVILIAARIARLVIALPQHPIDTSKYEREDIITRDVAIIGGGSAGTYSAVRLGDFNKSVVLVEIKGRLGGHTETYIDPATQIPVDYGVEIFHNLSVVTNYFVRFNVPLAKDNFPSVPTQWVDFGNGQNISTYTFVNTTAFARALILYVAQLQNYPDLDKGFFLPNPVPEDLLMPFGDFVTKYSLEATVYTIFQYTQSMGDI